jgi:CRISPR/Cas system-associated protein Cas5 (RAMP superfamily)
MLIQFYKYLSVALLLAVAVSSAPAQTTTEPRKSGEAVQRDRSASGSGANQYSDRDRRASWEKGKQELERSLKPGQDKETYRRELEKLGWKITSVNYDKPDYVEWEIVKGDETYEVQIDLKDNKAAKIDVAPNMWKAKATEEALRTAMTGSKAR